MKQIAYSAKFKRDYVTVAAIIGFVVLVLSEITLAVVIPLHLRMDDVWMAQIQQQQALSIFDAMRTSIRKAKVSRADAAGEMRLLANNLDFLAIYLRKYREDLSPAEYDQLRKDFTAMQTILAKLRNNKPYVTPQKLDTAAFSAFLIKKAENIEKEQNNKFK